MHTVVNGEVPAPACPVSQEFDPFGSHYQEDPASAQAEGGDVYFSETLGWYVITRHKDIRQVYADSESFSSQRFSEPITPPCPAAGAKLKEYGFKTPMALGALDEPIHLERRRRLEEPFRMENVALMTPRIRQVQTEYIDAFVSRGNADLVSELFYEAPAVIALEFMGVPDEDIARVKENAAGVLLFQFGRTTEEQQVATCDLMGRQYAYAIDLIARLKEDPSGPGLLQFAVRASLDEPEYFDDHFLISLCITSLAAAHETTSSSVANAMLELLRPRERWQAICADPSLIPGAVEECLRLAPTLTTGRRLCVKETVVSGVPIPAGSMVLLANAAGSRDEERFPEPNSFDPARRNAKHSFAFGYAGHYCLGARLARLQMEIVLQELARRLPHMRLVEGQAIEYVPTASSHTPTALLVEWNRFENPVAGDRPADGAAVGAS